MATEPTYRHVMDWDRYGKKGARCEILGGRGNSVQVRFEDGTTRIVNRQALRRAKPSELKRLDAKSESESILSLSPALPEDN